MFQTNASGKRNQKPKQNCVISSPLELAGANFEHLSNLSSIMAREWTNPKKILSTGESFHSSFKQMLSIFQLEYKTHPPTARAEALRIVYFIRKATSEEDQDVLNFETSFESLTLSIHRPLKCASLSFKTGKTTNDALQHVLNPEQRPLYMSALTMVLFVFIFTYLSCYNLSCFKTVLVILLSVI